LSLSVARSVAISIPSSVHSHFEPIMSASMNCSFGSENAICGSFGGNYIIVPLLNCDEDMTISLGISWNPGLETRSPHAQHIAIDSYRKRIDSQSCWTWSS